MHPDPPLSALRGALAAAGLGWTLVACSGPHEPLSDPFEMRDPPLAKTGPAFPEDLLGSWSEVEPVYVADQVMLLFEPSRVVARTVAGLSFREARYGTDSVLVRSGARFAELFPVLKGDQLLIHDLGRDMRLERLETTPAALVVEPLALGEPRIQTTQRTEEIQVALDRRRASDQAIRERLAEFRSDEIVSRMSEIDRENTAWLREVVQDVGWIDAERFGSDATNAAFLIVQHSGDLELMQAALPGLRADWDNGRVEGSEYALLHDRLSLALGRPQLYGSQLQGKVGEPLFLMPLSDPLQVERHREDVGLEPLDDYLERFVEGEEDPPQLLKWPAFGEL